MATVAAPPVAGARARWFAGSRARRLGVLVALFALWEFGARVADSRLLPGPVAVVGQLATDLGSGLIWFHAQLTLQRGLLGLVIALVLGVAGGVLLARVRWADATFEPILAATYPVPKLALYPLLILALGFGGASKVAMVALECVYPIVYNTYAGVQGLDKHLFWLTRNVGAGRVARTGVMLRGATPSIMAGVRMAVPIMLVIMVVTELIGESRGLGFLIRQAGTDFAPQSALAIILLLGIVGFLLDRVVVAITRRLAFWARGVQL